MKSMFDDYKEEIIECFSNDMTMKQTCDFLNKKYPTLLGDYSVFMYYVYARKIDVYLKKKSHGRGKSIDVSEYRKKSKEKICC